MSDNNRKQGLGTLAVHAGHVPDSATLSRAVPIYQTTSYVFRDAEHAANLFGLKEFGNIYTRLMNPTTDVLEKRIAAMCGGTGCVATASGMSAIFYAVASITSAGENIVSGTNLYGGTVTLFKHTLERFGIEVRFVDTSDPQSVEAAIDEKTKLVFTESVGNPKSNVDDLAAIADVAHAHSIPFIVDNTVTPPPIFNPFEHGADVVVFSLTKMIGGHGNSVGGAIVERGDFDWATSGKFPTVAGPDPSYNGADFWAAFGGHDDAVVPGLAYVLKIRCGMLRDTGACISPTNSFNIIQGIETLHLRAPRHCENAAKLAQFLESREDVEWVKFSGLAGHPDYERAKKLMPMGPGAIFGFGIKGGLEAAKQFIANVKLSSHLANVLDARTLVIHPASTTHQQLSDEEQQLSGVLPEMVRVSVGIEDIEDIIDDFAQALDAVAGTS